MQTGDSYQSFNILIEFFFQDPWMRFLDYIAHHGILLLSIGNVISLDSIILKLEVMLQSLKLSIQDDYVG